MKNSWYYFKIVFFSVGAGIFSGMLVYLLIMGLGETQFSFVEAFEKALVVSFGTALFLGLINIFARFDLTKKKELP